jgi:hypothetical protein
MMRHECSDIHFSSVSTYSQSKYGALHFEAEKNCFFRLVHMQANTSKSENIEKETRKTKQKIAIPVKV